MDRTRAEFIEREIDLAFTFLDLASTEKGLGDEIHAQAILRKARLGYETAARFLSDVKDTEAKDRLQTELERLLQALDRAGG
ncbi:MAG TPA: hypothetical protein VEU96_00425 [Bryobacteraceae bacterium]|nr:hypothetical protein [Bryobacteraceae bacterium]